jgi:hypothetical protein
MKEDQLISDFEDKMSAVIQCYQVTKEEEL